MKRVIFFFRSQTIALLLFLSACAVGPDYRPPEIEIPKEYISDSRKETSSTVETPTLWWTFFYDDALSKLIEESVEKNKKIDQLISRINQSRALAQESLAELFPGAQLSGQYEKAKASGARFPNGISQGFQYEIYSGSIDALWEADLFGGLRRKREQRNAQYAADVLELYDAVRVLIAEVGVNYFDLRTTQQRLRLLREHIVLQEKNIAILKAKFDYGAVSELDFVRAQTELFRTKGRIPLLESSVAASLHRLAVLQGKNPGDLGTSLQSPRELPEYQGPLRVQTPAKLLQRRPDILAAEKRFAAANAGIGVSISELYPKIQINGSLGVEAARFGDLDKNADTYRFGPTITWAAFDISRIRARIKASEAIAEEALSFYEATVLSALEDVENALSMIESEKKSLTHLFLAEKASRRAYELANIQYHEGEQEMLSVIDAQRSLLDLQEEVLLHKYQHQISIVSLYKALGGGWKDWSLKREEEKAPSNSNR